MPTTSTILPVKALFELLRRGVFLNPMGTKLYLSLDRTEADIDEFTGKSSVGEYDYTQLPILGFLKIPLALISYLQIFLFFVV